MSSYSRVLFIGAKVTLDHQSPYFKITNDRNPKGIFGEVISVNVFDDHGKPIWWEVKWSNGTWNYYQNGDLKVIGTVVGGDV